MNCPECQSPNNTEFGFYWKRKPTLTRFQQYRCKDCKRVFHDTIPMPDAPIVEVAGTPDPPPLSISELQSPKIESLTSCVEPVKENNPPNNT